VVVVSLEEQEVLTIRRSINTGVTGLGRIPVNPTSPFLSMGSAGAGRKLHNLSARSPVEKYRCATMAQALFLAATAP
jgi:hypothetical protein